VHNGQQNGNARSWQGDFELQDLELGGRGVNANNYSTINEVLEFRECIGRH